MTDKQKAIELSIKVMEDGHFESNGVCQRKQIENALMEMSEWKEKEMLDCAVSAYCECCDTKECEDYMGGECNWKLKFEEKLLKNFRHFFQ